VRGAGVIRGNDKRPGLIWEVPSCARSHHTNDRKKKKFTVTSAGSGLLQGKVKYQNQMEKNKVKERRGYRRMDKR